MFVDDKAKVIQSTSTHVPVKHKDARVSRLQHMKTALCSATLLQHYVHCTCMTTDMRPYGHQKDKATNSTQQSCSENINCLGWDLNQQHSVQAAEDARLVEFNHPKLNWINR